ncbi:MAG TPA: response regulator [Armatimonadota bacterium]
MIRVLLSENQPGDIDRIAAALAESGDVEVVALTRDGLETAQLISGLRPQVALVRAHMPGMDGFQTCRMAAVASPETACIIVADTTELEGEAREQAMRAGARAITSLREDPGQVLRLITELAHAAPQREDEGFLLATDPTRTPVTIAVTGAKGGIGKTTLTTNLAVSMAQRWPDQVVVVDFVGHYGDVNLLLDMPTHGNILDLSDYEEIDAELLRSRLSRHASGLWVLGGVNGPDNLEATGAMTMPYLANLLGALRREFRVIIFDIDPLVYPLSNYVFLRSNLIVVVTCLADLTTIRNTSSLLGSLVNARMPADRIKLVVSRFDNSDPFGIADLEQATKHPVAAQIPKATEIVVPALNSGVPFVISRPTAPVSKAVTRLADLLVREMPISLQSRGLE